MKKPEKTRNPNPARGFTLIEVLIALFVFAMIVSALFSVYRTTVSIIDEAESQEDIYQMARIALERITEDLGSTYHPEKSQSPQTDQAMAEPALFQGEKKEMGDLRCGELRFLSLAHLTFSDEKCLAEPVEIAYYGAIRGEENVLDLYRSDTSLTRERPESGTGGALLCKGLSSIDFIFYDADGEPHENWGSDKGPSGGRFPSRVSVLMEFPNRTNPDRPYRFMTGVAIPMGG